jgi:hypothetical protein
MGGNALKTVAVHRLSAPEYAALSSRVLGVLQREWPAARPHLVRSFRNKADFGDMDVLVDRSGLPANLASELRRLFASREVVHNGPVYSTEVDGFQLDLVTVDSSHYAASVDYFAWNDAGNLMGRVARRLGFKYGHAGLSYQLRDGDYLVADVEVSSDMPQVFAFLGYDTPGADHAAYQSGFDALEDMFLFVSRSRYFDPSAYALESRNHTARARDRKRVSYRRFLEWLEHHSPSPGPDACAPASLHLARAERAFPAFAVALSNARAGLASSRERRRRFNGELVQSWTGLEGRALGALMARCRMDFDGGPSAFDAWVLSVEDAVLRSHVLSVQSRFTAGE